MLLVVCMTDLLIAVDHQDEECRQLNAVMTLPRVVIEGLDLVMCALRRDIKRIMIEGKSTDGGPGLIVGVDSMSDGVRQAAVKDCLNVVVREVEMTKGKNVQDQMTAIEVIGATGHQDVATRVHHPEIAVQGLLIIDDSDLSLDLPAGLDISQKEGMLKDDAPGQNHQEIDIKIVVTRTKRRL